MTPIVEDLHWFGLRWDEGPDVGGAFAPYVQSQRREIYLAAWKKLRDAGLIYPCICSRRDVLQSANAPHHENEEPVYPGTCRPKPEPSASIDSPAGHNWRFRVPDGETLQFVDNRLGTQRAVAGVDFGDFIVWRKDDVPAYQLAVVADDAAMQISEVVRGADLLLSTFRQLLIYRALGWRAPQFYHTELITDSTGQRLAKRHASLSLRELRKSGPIRRSCGPILDRGGTESRTHCDESKASDNEIADGKLTRQSPTLRHPIHSVIDFGCRTV